MCVWQGEVNWLTESWATAAAAKAATETKMEERIVIVVWWVGGGYLEIKRGECIISDRIDG